MSLIRYGDGDSRSVVLRHQQTLVLYDPQSRQITFRKAGETPSSPHDEVPGLQSCPFCHRPMEHRDHTAAGNPGRSGRRRSATPLADSGFVDEHYFRMLNSSVQNDGAMSGGPSIGRHLPQLKPEDSAELSDASSTDELHPPGGIAASAFSPGYFNRFFQQTKVLGKGGKGVVLLVEHVLDGVHLGYFACKRVPVGNDHEWLKKVLIEVQLLQKLSHQNLVSYRHVWLENVQLTNFGPKVPCAFILQQYCNAGDLHNYVLGPDKMPTKEQLKERMRRRSRGKLDIPEEPGLRKLPFEQIISFFRDIASGLSHLHLNGFIHRDLKPSNCLLHETPGHGITVLVSDFGEVQQVDQIRNSTGATGTISYCAPEVLTREFPGGNYGNFTEKSDVFSLGMILHFMCFGRLPYVGADSRHEENEDLDALRAEITAWKGLDDFKHLRSDLPERLYHSLKTLISPDPAHRPSAADILLGIEIGIGEDLHAAGRRGSGSSGVHSTPKRSPGSIPASAFMDRDDSPMIGFRRISPVADTPPPGTPTHSVTDLPETLNTRPKRFDRPWKRGSRSDHVRTSSLLSEGPTSVESTEPSSPAVDNLSPDSTIVVRPLLEPAGVSAAGATGVASTIWWQRYWTSPHTRMWTKLFVFLLKIVAMNQPCAPLMVKAWAYYPLLGLAAMDFTTPMLISTLVLAFMHFVLLAMLRWSGNLCTF
ncbi:kinase-like protein [Ascodesmis nigricans]|uniref:non-specific serine/threonine protein kinase n=1 Tax=Ascodesmis nigricans TaxID=341454 RepID=A0A4S2N3M1_9PEZI|nr:kinase-like protein [Ascodesmis nigricans]